MLVFLIMGMTGLVDSLSDAVPLLFLQLLSPVAAGYVAGRLSSRDQVLHGGYAGLLLFAVATGIALAADPDSASLLVIAFSGLLTLVLGSSGGALAKAASDR